ncbi:MAG: signal recognition particle-docking protein FtsY [Desulfobacterales bacterium]
MAFKWFKKKDKDRTAEAGGPHTESETPPEAGEGSVAAESSVDDGQESSDESAFVPAEVEPDPEADTAAPPESAAASEETKGRFFARLKKGLTKTRDFLNTDIEDLFRGGRRLDAAMLEDLEELLITADIGVQTSMKIIERISSQAAKVKGAEGLKTLLRDEIRSLVEPYAPPPETFEEKPHVIMVVGVNGVGKTTTIGKLAARYAASGNRVLIGAADTFRAAAIEQLSIWADRADAQIVRHKDHADPAAVAYDAVDAASARGMDVVLIDTAGRLHTKVNLMEELKKIKRSIGKRMTGAPHETLLVLDATTGQNALSQAKLFNDALELTGLALTKLDGTAKGGIVIGICGALNIPLRYIGVGEQLDDLQVFDPEKYVQALF